MVISVKIYAVVVYSSLNVMLSGSVGGRQTSREVCLWHHMGHHSEGKGQDLPDKKLNFRVTEDRINVKVRHGCDGGDLEDKWMETDYLGCDCNCDNVEQENMACGEPACRHMA